MEIVKIKKELPQIRINGTHTFFVRDYSIRQKRAVAPVEEVYQSVSRLHCGTVQYEIQCRQLVPAGVKDMEPPLDFSELGKFTLAITDGGRETVFKNCLWTSVAEEYKTGEHQYVSVTIASPHMERAETGG